MIPSRESVAALAACTVVAVLVSRRLLQPDVFSDDAFVHQYWMWQWRDPQLFNDALTADLRGSARYPDGYQALFWLASHVADPITFGEWVGVALMATSAWLVFLIVREHTSWRPAAWIAAGLFLSLVDIHRFHGGFPRAFVHPVVLLTVLLAMRRHELSAALVAAGGALLYPPAALLAIGVLIVSSIRVADRRPRVDARRASFALLALAVAIVALLGSQIVSGSSPRVMTAAEARMFPEFGAHGPLHFFVPSTIDYLRQNRSGFDLRTSGSMLAVAALALLVIRRRNLQLLRAEVVALPVVALGAWALAQAVLFKLYLPHRYTYPLLAFFAIVVGVMLRPTRSMSAVGASLAGVALLGALVVIPDRGPRGSRCPTGAVTKYLSSLPKDAVIAGDPIDLKCLPATARRAVVISTQLAPSYEADYFRRGRARMFATLAAYYGPSADAIADLQTRYGATDLWVRREAVRKELTFDGRRWRRSEQPYGRFVRRLVSPEPAVLALPASCLRFKRGPNEVYDIGCVALRQDEQPGAAKTRQDGLR